MWFEPTGRSSTTSRSRSIAAIKLNFSPDPLTVRSSVFTFLPYGSDNYVSSDKETGGLDRTNRGADRRVSREVGPRPSRARPAKRQRYAQIYAVCRRHSRWPAQLVDAQGILEKVRGIADTGLLVAVVNSRDAHHTWSVRIADQVAEPLLTCAPILPETAFDLGHVDCVFEPLS